MGTIVDVDLGDVTKITDAIKAIPDVDTPSGYDAIDLATLDAVYSLGITYTAVKNMLEHYRAEFGVAGTATGLIDAIDNCGGAEEFAVRVNNRNRTSSKNGILKGQAVRDAAEVLRNAGIDDHQTFLKRHVDNDLDDVKAAWLSVKGQSSGISWRYFLILNRIDDVKPDRMIQRFCERVLERRVDTEEAVALVSAAAAELQQSTRHVDHRIWRHESETVGDEETGDPS